MSGYLFLTAPLFKKVKRCRSLNFKEVRDFSFLRIGKISGIEANHTSLFKGLFSKARNVPLRGIYFILLQHVALFYITGFSVRFPNFVSLKIEPYGKKKIQRVVKRSVKVPLWSQEKEKSTGKDRNSVELNHYIDALRVKFYQIYQDLELEGKIISARAIVNRYQGKDETFKTLYNVFKEHNDNCRKLIGTDYADITVRRYDNCLKYLMELVKRDYKVDDMLLREVNGELVRKFDLYLKTEKHCAQNTVIRYMKCFKKVINLAIANEWLTKNPFAGIKFHEVEVNKQFLSQAEINRIWQKEFRIERLELVRDVFIFCVYTGLACITCAPNTF